MARKKDKVEFRYYEVPQGEPLLALLGEAWIRPYGYDENDKPIDCLHFHNLLEIGYCYEGTGEIVLEDTSYTYGPGTFTVIPKNYPHTTNAVREKLSRWEYLFIDAEKTLQTLYPDGRRYGERFLECMNRLAFCTTKTEQPVLAAMILAILKEMTLRREMYDEAVRGLLRPLFVEISRFDMERSQEKEKRERAQQEETKRPEQSQISRALEYVGDYYDRPLKVSDLAGACHMSETHFRRLFVRSMNMHPVDYINQVRIKMACERLKKNNEPIAEVAQKCGFTSLATFNRNFRNFMGVAPNEWRKQPEAYERRLQQKQIAVFDGW